MRATDIGALSGLQNATGISDYTEDKYQTVDDREMAAYYEGVHESHKLGIQTGIGEELTQEELDTFRSGL